VTEPGPWRSYKEKVAGLSQRIVEAQRPIRLLHSIRWGVEVEAEFRRGRWKGLPPVDRAFYEANDPGFDPAQLGATFADLRADVVRALGESDDVGRILAETCDEYRQVCRMVEVRGTKEFHDLSRRLYGSTRDTFSDGKTTVRDLGLLQYEILTNLDVDALGAVPPRDLDAAAGVRILNDRFAAVFGEEVVMTKLDDGIVADAAAGADYVKLREGASFSLRDLDLLEVHEGWVHVGTALNGQSQPVARWLAKGPPRTASVQEGLASLVETLTFRSYPRRARRLNDRILSVHKAEDGASFADVFEWFRTEGYEESECFASTRRIFRGGLVEGGAPFTKDLTYCIGLVQTYDFIRSAIRMGRPELIPFLFVGKLALADVPVLWERSRDRTVLPPKFLPPPFRDLNGIAVWMGYSTFLASMHLPSVEEHYRKLLRA
jgi:uncharacterized protein (TIGR02421 family)